MALSDDLIAQFAKITKDKPERVKEATVYGNIVIQNDKKFVMIDGSNTLTPVVSTSEANEGERVTVMIKDHTATITGNITNPSSSTGTVDKLTEDYNDVDSRVTEMEDILSGDVDFNDIKDAINSKADKSAVNALDKRVGDVESDVKDISDSVATIAGDLKDKADSKEVSDISDKMNEIDALVQEHERILNEGDGPDVDPEGPTVPIHLSDDTATVENGFIKNDMIDSVDAGKLKSGTIDNSLVKIQDAQELISMQNGLLTIKDANGDVRFEVGMKNGHYTFSIWNSHTGDVINQNGIVYDPYAITAAVTIYNNYLTSNYLSMGSGYALQDYIDALEQEIQDMKNALNNNGIYW